MNNEGKEDNKKPLHGERERKKGEGGRGACAVGLHNEISDNDSVRVFNVAFSV